MLDGYVLYCNNYVIVALVVVIQARKARCDFTDTQEEVSLEVSIYAGVVGPTGGIVTKYSLSR